MGRARHPLSKNADILNNFSLNQETQLESVVRALLSFSIDKEACSAQVSIPALTTGVNFFPDTRHPLYSLELTLGVVPDLVFTRSSGDATFKPTHNDYEYIAPVSIATPWTSTRDSLEPTLLDLQLPSALPDPFHTLILCAGLRYGYAAGNTTVQ
jgi:hypothetical protein